MPAPLSPSLTVLKDSIDKLPAGGLGDLGTRLQNDAAGAVRDQYLASFEAAAAKARERLVRPLPPEDFAASSALVEASEAAAEVVQAAWAAMHATAGALRSGP
jgi:hypothetical protein